MIIDGKRAENISCKQCRFRHPASVTCHRAAEIAQAERERIAEANAVLAGDEPLETWQALFYDVARSLKCLPSQFHGGNVHILRKAAGLIADNEALAAEIERPTAALAEAERERDALKEALRKQVIHFIPASRWDSAAMHCKLCNGYVFDPAPFEEPKHADGCLAARGKDAR